MFLGIKCYINQCELYMNKPLYKTFRIGIKQSMVYVSAAEVKEKTFKDVYYN